MLECYSLKQQLNLARQQLAHALYQQDAACRVIARLTRERDDARTALATAQAQPSAAGSSGTSGDGMEVEAGAGIPEQVKQRLLSVSKQLTTERKKRTVPKETATEDQIKSLHVTSSHPTHSSSKPGILCLDLHPNQKLAATGGVDRNVVVLNRESGVAAPALTGHTKRVNRVAFHPERDMLMSASHDGTVRLWAAQGEENDVPRYAAAGQLQPHGGAEVVSLSLHPTGDFIASASLNGSWAFSDLSSQRTLVSVPSPIQESVHAASFHPDGLIYSTGTSTAKVRVWDMKTLNNVATFDGHTGPVRSIAFSENGFYMASAGDDHTVRLWDLRKLKSFQTISLPDSELASVAFDYSGKYLAIGGSDVRVYGFAGKVVEPLVTLADHSAPVTGVLFGQHAHLLASTSLDRTIKFFQTSA
jgi:pre-mRNA-processing factor 19